ncbi:transposase [Pseudomonadota bacterium]
MQDDTTRQSVVFKDLFGRPVVARFDQPDSSSDGGALLLKGCDEQLGLTDALAGCVDDGRQQSKVEHSFRDLRNGPRISDSCLSVFCPHML